MKQGVATGADERLQLVIFDFDGTLFDTRASIAHCMHRTFVQLAPSRAPPTHDTIRATIATGVGLREAFQMLQPSGSGGEGSSNGIDTENWVRTYRRLYNSEGLRRITPYAGAEAVLRFLKARRTAVAIVTNKGVAAVHATLRAAGLDTLVELVVGDTTPGFVPKPDVTSFVEMLGYHFAGVNPVCGWRCLVVGDTEADIGYARSFGGKVVWCRYGYGRSELCERQLPDWTVDSLGDVIKVVETNYKQ